VLRSSVLFHRCHIFFGIIITMNHRVHTGTFTKKPIRICEAVDCFAEATTEIVLSASPESITLGYNIAAM
jgi:hypothetical protein